MDKQIPELIESLSRGTYSSISDAVRRNLASFRQLQRITVSQNAPEWRREAMVVEPKPRGLATIVEYDRAPYTEVWYKTGTKGHKAKAWIR